MNVRPFIFFAFILIVSGSVSAQTDPAEIWATDARYSSGTFSESDGSRDVNGYDCNRGIQSDRIELDSIKGDSFCVSDADADTWKWNNCCNLSVPVDAVREIVSGVLILNLTSCGGVCILGISSSGTYSGDWDVRIHLDKTLSSGDDQFEFMMMNEPNRCATGTVDGIDYVLYESTLLSLRCFNGALSQYGASTIFATDPLWLRISRNGIRFSTFYSSDGITWILDDYLDDSLILDPMYAVICIVGISGGDPLSYWDDFYNPASDTVDPGGYRTGGTWNTSSFEVDSPQRVGWIDYNHTPSFGDSCIENVTLLDNGNPIEYWQASFPLGVCAPPIPPLEALSNVTADEGITVSFTFFGDGNQTISVRYIAVTKVMVDTSSLTFLILFLIVFLFIVGIFHEAFWLVCAFVCFIAASEFTALYPNTLWAFVFVVMGIMLIVLMFARATGAKLGIRVVKT